MIWALTYKKLVSKAIVLPTQAKTIQDMRMNFNKINSAEVNFKITTN